MAEIFADISAKKGPFWIEPQTAYSRVLPTLTGVTHLALNHTHDWFRPNVDTFLPLQSDSRNDRA